MTPEEEIRSQRLWIEQLENFILKLEIVDKWENDNTLDVILNKSDIHLDTIQKRIHQEQSKRIQIW